MGHPRGDKSTTDNSNLNIRVNKGINVGIGGIGSAIQTLLSSESFKVSKPTVQLTECSPDIDIVMNEHGGICTICNSIFKSKIALDGHVKKCNSGLRRQNGSGNKSRNEYKQTETNKTVNVGKLKLVVVN